MKINFSALSAEERTAALAALDNDGLAAALNEARTEATALFALTEPTIEQVNEAEAIVASIGHIETEQTTRAAAVKDAADRFAAARSTFSEADAEDEAGEEDEAEDEADEDDEEDEAEPVAEVEADADTDADSTVAASVNHTAAQRVKVTAARKVGAKTKRPERKPASPVTITAAADISGIPTGSVLNDMEHVTKALMSRVKGFAPFNKRAAEAVNSQSSGEPVLHKFGVASFGIDFDSTLTASSGNDYSAVQAAFKQDRFDKMGSDGTLTAAGWCAPSETVYSFIADYVVDGLITVPEVSAPRGGINITTGPVRSTQGTALDDFGWTQTEAQAEAGTVKPCEVIDCPDFVDHRLDAVGYCYKIPLLTQKAYPELITDALRLADVLYAHRTNRRIIADLVALSTAVTFSGYGASFTDALEALSLLATKERRKWSIGENAKMEVKVPVWAKEVFRADMSRRTGLALTDVATDQKIAAEFAARNLAVEYVADWQELTGTNITLPGSFQIMVYPAGTFVKAVEDVVNLSAVYDAASLSVNEYTGVFFEQGILTAKAGYGSSLLTIPVNTAGETGAAIMTGLGDSTAGGSF